MRNRPVLATLLVAGGLVAGCSGSNVFSLESGTCFDRPGGNQEVVSDVPIIECAEEHDNEVFATFDLPDGDFPGQTAVGDLADDGCLDRFEGYVGSDADSSRFVRSSLFPTAETWDQGDREVVCFLSDIDDAKLMGSVADSGE